MKRILIILAMIGLLASCTKEPLSTQSTENPEISVSLLFEYDGIKVYRFFDGGRAHYFTKNSVTTIYSCGKGCTYEEKIETK